MKNLTTAPKQADFDRLRPLIPTPERLPFTYVIGNRAIQGIPADFNPEITEKDTDAATYTTIRGVDPATGIAVIFEMEVLKDYPVCEWIVYVENTTDTDSPIIKQLYAAQFDLPGTNPILHSCTGDGKGLGAFIINQIPMTSAGRHREMPCGGRPTSEAFPYYTIMTEEGGYHVVVGWSGEWMTETWAISGGMRFEAKQYHTHFYLKPGEKIRTPRLLLFPFSGDEARGRNLWRRYYFDHIIPKAYPGFPEPIVFCHEQDRPGSEWTNATEEGQVRCLKGFLERGMKFNAWWIDAGWFPCGGDWGATGPWYPDPERFPNKMKPIGDVCAENNIRFLLWFEPERTRLPSRDPNWKDEWLLDWVRITGEGKEDISLQYLYNLGDDEAREYMTNTIDKVIKEAGVKIFRSDFNILPWGHWTCNEKWNRRGITENHYVCGYLKMWADIAARNPGILIDSCASGGMRNDLETMRLSVPMQYTDFGIGANEPFKAAFSRTMFTWIPYFRQHSGYWGGAMDNYAYHLAIVPAITFLMPHSAPQETIDYCIKMAPIHDRAARRMLDADYYPLLPDSRDPASAYCVQFHNEEAKDGLIHLIRHEKNEQEAITVYPLGLLADATYCVESPEFGKTFTLSGKEMMENGVTFRIPARSGEILFYHEI